MISDRFRQLPGLLGKRNLSQIAREVQFSSQALNKIARGESKPGFELLVTIVEKYPISEPWLLRGHGPPLREDGAAIQEPEISYDKGSANDYRSLRRKIEAMQEMLIDMNNRLRNLEEME